MFPIIDLMSTITLIVMLLSYTWLFVYADARDFLGDNDAQKIETLKTPSNMAYGEAFLNSPLQDGIKVVDYVVSSKEDPSELKKQLNLFFKDTEFNWYLAAYGSPFDEIPLYTLKRNDWRFQRGFDGYEDYLVPNYFDGSVMKVTLAIGEGVWIPAEEAEEAYNNAPGRAIGGVV